MPLSQRPRQAVPRCARLRVGTSVGRGGVRGRDEDGHCEKDRAGTLPPPGAAPVPPLYRHQGPEWCAVGASGAPGWDAWGTWMGCLGDLELTREAGLCGGCGRPPRGVLPAPVLESRATQL